jgi:hypothetical protein
LSLERLGQGPPGVDFNELAFANLFVSRGVEDRVNKLGDLVTEFYAIVLGLKAPTLEEAVNRVMSDDYLKDFVARAVAISPGDIGPNATGAW